MILRDDLLEPIPGDNPAGMELRYEPVYDQIKLARTEEDDIPQGEWERERKTADFPRVIELAQEAIASRSKDLQLAAWLAEALLHEEGFQGFLEALELIRGLMANFWDGLYPELEDGDAEFRAMPLEWLGSYLDLAVKSVPLNERGHSLLAYLEAQSLGYEADAPDDKAKAARAEAIAEGKVSPEQFDAGFEATPKAWYKSLVGSIDGCLGTIVELDREGEERFGPVAPGYGSLKTSIGEVRRVAAKLLERKLEVDPDPPEPVQVLDDPDASESRTSPETAVSVVPTTAAEAAARIADAARFLRQEDPRNPAPYSLLRGFRWAEIRRAGDPPDPRLLEAPPTPVRTRLKTLLLDQNWPALLEAAEDVMATPFGRGWLDLQRYVVSALNGLGDEYQSVRTLVLSALGGLLRDLPSLPDQTLMDDSPTANRQTLQWLQSEGVWPLGGESGSPTTEVAAPTRSGGSLAAVVQQARTLARNGDPSRSVETLLGAAKAASHPREAFLYRSEAAAILVDQGLDAVALPILDDMVQAIESHALDRWEAGTMVARPLGLLYRVRSSAGQPADDLYEQICRLDPVQAVRFEKEQGGGMDPEPAVPVPPPPPDEEGP